MQSSKSDEWNPFTQPNGVDGDGDSGADGDGGDECDDEDGPASDLVFDPHSPPEWVQLLTTRSPFAATDEKKALPAGAAANAKEIRRTMTDSEEDTALDALTAISALSPNATRVRTFLVENGVLSVLRAIFDRYIPRPETAVTTVASNTDTKKSTADGVITAAMDYLTLNDTEPLKPAMDRLCKAVNALGSLAVVGSVGESIVSRDPALIDAIMFVLRRSSLYAQSDGCYAIGWFLPIPSILNRVLNSGLGLRLLSILNSLLEGLRSKKRVTDNIENLRTFALVALQKLCVLTVAHSELIAIPIRDVRNAIPLATATAAGAGAGAAPALPSNTKTSDSKAAGASDTDRSALLEVLTEIISLANTQSYTLLTLAMHTLYHLSTNTGTPAVRKAMANAVFVGRLIPILNSIIEAEQASTATAPSTAAPTDTSTDDSDPLSERSVRSQQLITLASSIADNIQSAVTSKK